MDENKARQFDELIRRKRNREIKAVAMIVIALSLMLIFLFVPIRLSESEFGNGTVLSWSRAQTDEGSGSYIIWTETTDGSKMNVWASRHGKSPFIGERIEIVKVRILFRGTHYRWKR